jgi:hypothetical protein
MKSDKETVQSALIARLKRGKCYDDANENADADQKHNGLRKRETIERGQSPTGIAGWKLEISGEIRTVLVCSSNCDSNLFILLTFRL